MMHVREATPAEMVYAYDIISWIALENDNLVAAGGFRRDKGRLWGFLDVFSEVGSGLSVVRAAKRIVEKVKEPIYAMCDHELESAPRLLRLLGFSPTDESRCGMTIWRR